MKVIFLDIDGVMNSISTKEMIELVNKNRDNAISIGTGTFHKTAIESLNNLMLSVQNVWIVITSTWREYHTVFELKRMFHNAGFRYPYRIFDVTSIKPKNNRPAQILSWLKENAIVNEVNSFMIIDDKLLTGLLENYLHQVNFETGLTQRDVDCIVKNFRENEYRLSKIWRMIRNQ